MSVMALPSEIPPPEELGDLTVDALRRLLRTRLRQCILKRGMEEHPESVDASIIPIVLDVEREIEANALASWLALRTLWDTSPRDDQRRVLRGCLQRALTETVEQSARFLEEKQAAFPTEDVETWARDFIASVDEGDLVKKF
jgi:hypothetical protein